MTKTDKSLHNICIASIKRSTMEPYDFKWTKFYNLNSEFTNSEINTFLEENELFICSTIIDNNNYSILTTQRLITKENGDESIGRLIDATDNGYGEFKGDKTTSISFGSIVLKNGKVLKYFIEVGKASMVMIHGVRTIIRTQQMSNKQVNNVTRIRSQQNEKK